MLERFSANARAYEIEVFNITAKYEAAVKRVEELTAAADESARDKEALMNEIAALRQELAERDEVITSESSVET